MQAVCRLRPAACSPVVQPCVGHDEPRPIVADGLSDRSSLRRPSGAMADPNRMTESCCSQQHIQRQEIGRGMPRTVVVQKAPFLVEGKFSASCTKITTIFWLVQKSLGAKNGDVHVQIQNSRILIQKQRPQQRDDGHNDTRRFLSSCCS